MEPPIADDQGTPATPADPKADALKDVQKRFTYHAPKADQPQRYGQLRDRGRELAELIVLSTPVSPEQAKAIDHLEVAVMLANAAIARNE